MQKLTALIVTVPLALAASTSAQAARVQVDVLHPAQVDLPADVIRVAVIDRSGSSNAGQAVLGTLEAAVTGEGIGGDRDAARQAVQTMAGALRASPRFEVVDVRTDRKRVEASLWDKAMSPKAVRALCLDVCDAIVALESFDTDGGADGVVRSTGAVATWRVYHADNGAILDSERMIAGGRGASVGGPVVDMWLNNRLAGDIGDGTALAYAARIAPTWQQESRRLLGTHRNLRAGIRAAKAGDWSRAVAHWEASVEHGNRRQRGKALFNLAVAAEAQGQLDTAIDLASDADALLTRRAPRDLAVRLRMRSADDDRLKDQLAAR